MKKILALTLAAVMAAGMTTVAFADANVDDKDLEIKLIGQGGNTLYVDGDDDGRFGTADDTFTTNDGSEKTDGKVTILAPTDDGVPTDVDLSVVKGGKKVAIPLLLHGVGRVDDKDDIRNIKVKTDWKVGELDEKPIIEYVKINDEYRYAVTFTLPEGQETKTADLAGKISVYNKSSQLKDDYEYSDYVTLKIGSEYGYEEKELEAWDDLADAEVVIFKDNGENLEGEYTLTFGDYMEFITFEHAPSFNKIGRVYIYAPEDAFIYKKGADGAEKINGLEWDEDYEAWTFKTRTLDAYVISDVELDEKTVTDDNSSTTEDGNKQNPDTGR